jgi:hypothetical protein
MNTFITSVNLSFFERQMPFFGEGSRQIRVTAMVIFRPLQQQIGIGVASLWLQPHELAEAVQYVRLFPECLVGRAAT